MNMMMKAFNLKYTLLLIVCVISFSGLSQNKKHKPSKEERAKIESLRKSFLSNKLELAYKDSVKFWPIYNKYEKQTKANFKAIKTEHKRLKDEKGLTDNESKTILEKIFVLEAKRVEIKRISAKEYASIIGYKKTAQIEIIEREFKRKLLKELKERGKR